MNKNYLLLGLLLLTGCSDDKEVQVVKEIQEVEKEVLVEVEKVTTVEKPVYIEVPQKFEGIFNLDNNSVIETLVDVNGDVTIDDSNQFISVTNEDSSNGVMPRIIGSNVQIVEGVIAWTRNVRYKTSNNIKDTLGVVDANRKTNFIIYFNQSDLLVLEIKIFDDSIGKAKEVVAHHVFKEQN